MSYYNNNQQQPPYGNPSYYNRAGGPPPPQQQPAYGTGYGGAPGYGAPPPQQQGYGGQQPGYGAPPPRQGYGGQGGGYGAGASPQAPGMPSRDQLMQWFRAVDRDQSGAIDAMELKAALVNGDWTPFSDGTIHLMIGMFDRDRSGTIDFQEFCSLWKYIEDWKKCFRTFDADGSGTIDRNELAGALRAFGFNVPQRIVDILIFKFDCRGRGDINFDYFINACVTIKTITESFQRYDTDRDGWVNMNYETFLELVVMNK